MSKCQSPCFAVDVQESGDGCGGCATVTGIQWIGNRGRGGRWGEVIQGNEAGTREGEGVDSEADFSWKTGE